MSDEFETTIEITPMLYQKIQKMMLQCQIAQEMRQYEDDNKWEQYRIRRTLQNVELGYLQN